MLWMTTDRCGFFRPCLVNLDFGKGHLKMSLILEAQFLRAAMESAGDGAWDRWREDDEKVKEMRMGSDRVSLDLLLF